MAGSLVFLAACTVEAPESIGSGAAPAADVEIPAAQKSTEQKNHSTPAVAGRDLKRRPWFGDLHVHSSWSLDSYINFNPVDPEQAYRFARGEEVSIAGGRRLQLASALDFAAVTDHAEYLGELSLCLDEETAQYTLPLCRDIRNETEQQALVTRVYKELIIPDVSSPDPQRQGAICGADKRACEERARNMWQRLIAVADAHNDPGRFTTFAAYEWTGNTDGNNLHRNVIFSNQHVPARPISHFEASTPALLWRQLKESCRPPCAVLAIPHNANQSRGRQFPSSLSQEDAQLRSELEPLVELIQGKGNSECKMGVGTADEYCNFELLERRPVCSDDNTTQATDCIRVCRAGDEPGTCIHANSYLRNALKEGLRLEEALGVNPYRFGVIAGTDTHNGTPGATDERNYMGLFGAEDATPAARARLPAIKAFKPPRLHSAAGLAAVWAEENTRASIFAALARRETFATSGTRIILRFFGGWDFGNDRLDDMDIARHGYQRGVAMGAALPRAAGQDAPEFLFWAMKAADGAPLQRVQLIKGWREQGESREATYDLACSDGLVPDARSHRCPDNGAAVDLNTCAASGDTGAVELKGRWQDPDFDASQAAFYYIRVLENPSCRWSTWEALREGRPPFEDVPPLIQERAWSSAIWYRPDV